MASKRYKITCYSGDDQPRVVSLAPQTAFRLERIECERPAAWMLCDVRVGPESQLTKQGDFPLHMLTTPPVPFFARIAEPGQQIHLLLRNDGPADELELELVGTEPSEAERTNPGRLGAAFRAWLGTGRR